VTDTACAGLIGTAVTACLDGVEPRTVHVEADVAPGLPSFTVVGLTDRAVQEARQRVKPALQNSGFGFPSNRVTINLAPAGLHKEGSAFDVAIAVAVLRADDVGKKPVLGPGDARTAFIGELGLDGRLKPVRGALSLAAHLAASGAETVYAPEACAAEAAESGATVIPVASLSALVRHLRGEVALAPWSGGGHARALPPVAVDLADIEGQVAAKRAVIIAAAGGHHLLLQGPPGTGKTLLARAMAGVLPDLPDAHSIEVSRIHSVAGFPVEGLTRRPPLRMPHHTISIAGLLGAGVPLIPGELTLAHRGVLVMDEMPEFRRDCLEALRGPLEEGTVRLSRAGGTRVLPARFTLVATANPCPCGLGNSRPAGPRGCSCGSQLVATYARRISGPIRDRIDLTVGVRPLRLRGLRAARPGETSATARERVEAARARQAERQGLGRLNSELVPRELDRFCRMSPAAARFLPTLSRTHQLSGRGFHGAVRVALTLADLEGSEVVGEEHLLEACEYRGG
jgi:magnesium chelatase family protein